MNDPVLVNIVEHLVHDGGDNFLRTTGDGESDRGGVQIAREIVSGVEGFFLEEVPFAFVLDQGNEVSDERSVQWIKRMNEGEILTDRGWLPISAIEQSSP